MREKIQFEQWGQMTEANFFDLYFSNSDFDGKCEGFHLENLVPLESDYFHNEIKLFDSM